MLAAKTGTNVKKWGFRMADNQDMTQANNTFHGFTMLIKWGTIVAVILTGVVILAIS